jgi:glycosyltransferase involved in cell wall biosynthesis
VDQTAEDWLVASLDVERKLPKSIWARMSDGAPSWKKLLRYPVHGWQTYRACKKLLSESDGESPDVIFFPSVFTHHLVGLVPFIRQISHNYSNTRFLLFFPNTPICYDPVLGRAAPEPYLTAKWFPALLSRLCPLVESGQVILGVETLAMQIGLTELCGLKFTYFPHPVHFPAGPEFAREDDCLVLGHYGSARYEKGSDLFQSAAKIYLDRHPEAKVRFIMQWLTDLRDDAGNWVRKDSSLVSHPKFQFIDRYFQPDGGYLRQVAATDVMILPYRDSYRYRLSRVVIEAMLAGLPVVATRGTTLYEQATEHGAVVGIEMDSLESLVQGIEEVVANFKHLRCQARDKIESAAHHFSVLQFRELLKAG